MTTRHGYQNEGFYKNSLLRHAGLVGVDYHILSFIRGQYYDFKLNREKMLEKLVEWNKRLGKGARKIRVKAAIKILQNENIAFEELIRPYE